MEAVEKMNEAIFERAAKLIRNGKKQSAEVIIDSGKANEPYHYINVNDQMDTEIGKDMVSSFLDMLSHRPDTAIIAFVCEAWALTDPEGVKEMARPSTHPKRMECVVVSFSIGNQRAIVMHKIVRPVGKRPRLLRGELQIEKGEAKLEGRFFAERKQAH